MKSKEFEKAALVAHEVMLQELNENELTVAACLLSCVKYLKEFRNHNAMPVETTADSQGEQVNNNFNEDTFSPNYLTKHFQISKVKLLVYFKRKEYNDEHFDLNDIMLLCGKTIVFASSNLKSADAALVNSLKVYGLLLFKKYDAAMDLIENVYLKQKGQLYKFLVKLRK